MTKSLQSVLKVKLYELMDSFLVEGDKPRSIERLNQDRHLFVENVLHSIADLLEGEGSRIKGMKLPYYARIAQNRNGLDYCSTCEQAWEDCSCSARNTGYKKAIDDVSAHLAEVVRSIKSLGK